MMLIEPEAARPRYTAWDALVAALLGTALLAAGALDVRSHLLHPRDKSPPGLAFVEHTGTEQDDENASFRRGDTVAWLEHVGGLEETPRNRFRHAYGPQSGLVIFTPNTRARLHFRLYNPTVGQELTVRCNGQVIEQFTGPPVGIIERTYPLALRPGVNEVTFTFARYNHAGADLAPNDPRLIAGTFRTLDLTME